LDITFWITPPTTTELLQYTVLIFQLRGKTCLDSSKKEKSLKTNGVENLLEGYLFCQNLEEIRHQIRFPHRFDYCKDNYFF